MLDASINIFISYSRTDSAFVDNLEADLRKQGLSTWVDRRRLEGGRKWRKELEKAIDRCQVLLVVLSPDSVASDFVQAEYGYASDEHKLVIPLYYRPCKVPLDLRGTQWIDFHESYDEGFKHLLKAVNSARGVSIPPTPSPSGDNTAALPSVSFTRKPGGALAGYFRNRPLLCGTIFLLLILAILGSVRLLYFANHSTSTANGLSTPHIPLATGTAQATSTGVTSTTTIPYPPNKGTLALNDPLRDNSHNYNWDDSSTNCQFSDDGYHVTTAIKYYTFFCNAFATNFSNFVYEVQMTILKGDSGGLIFRANADNATDYYFRIDSTGSYLLIVFTGHTSSGILQSGTIPGFHTGLGKSNLIAVVANGDHLSLYVNHSHITNVTDGTYSQGQIGVAASTADSPPVEVVFSNAKLWKL